MKQWQISFQIARNTFWKNVTWYVSIFYITKIRGGKNKIQLHPINFEEFAGNVLKSKNNTIIIKQWLNLHHQQSFCQSPENISSHRYLILEWNCMRLKNKQTNKRQQKHSWNSAADYKNSLSFCHFCSHWHIAAYMKTMKKKSLPCKTKHVKYNN